MRPETEALLDKLSAGFAQEGKNSPVAGKKRKKINHRIFIEQVASGAKLADAVKAAGSTGKSENALQVHGSQILAEHPEYREAITDLIAEKQRLILASMTKQKIEDASLSSQAVAFGILTDKGELLAGRPTSRVESDIDLKSLEKQQLMAYLLGKMSAGKKLNGNA